MKYGGAPDKSTKETKDKFDILREQDFGDAENHVSDTDSGDAQSESDNEEEKAYDDKIRKSKDQHKKFTEQYQDFLELKDQIKIDNERFKSSKFVSTGEQEAQDEGDNKDGGPASGGEE